MTRAGMWRAAQGIAVVTVLAYVAARIAGQWGEIAALPGRITVNWALVAASCLVVLVSYGVLIWTWLRMVRAWGERLRARDAARIWFVSNLGRYVPGKVWQIGAMGMMSQRAGISPVAAVGSSLVISIVNVLSGIGVAVATGVGSLDARGFAIPAVVLMAAGVIATPWILPWATRAARRVLRREIPEPRLPASAVWVAAVGCTTAWFLYGAAFRLLHVALLGPTGDLMRSTAAFTGSYIVGFLMLFAPGGIGVREAALQNLLPRLGLAAGADAWLVVLVSRAWLTILEIIPGLLFLARGRRAADTTPPTP
jgi:hypothetical protein